MGRASFALPFADLAENVKARATLTATFPRFLPTNAPLFDQCLPPGLDFTRRVHLDRALQLVGTIAKTHIVKNVQMNARRHFIFDKVSRYIARASCDTLYIRQNIPVFFKLLLIT